MPTKELSKIAGSIGHGLSTVITSSTSSSNSTPSTLQLLVQSFDNMDENREIELGRRLASVLLGSKGVDSDRRAQAYLNHLGRWISLHSTRPDLPWTFVIIDDAGFNAFAAPGGFVFITRGLLNRVSTEAELAGVLAHEITHVTEKHHLKALQKLARTQLAAQAAQRMLSNNLADDIATRAINLGKELYSKGLDRADEFQADRQAVTLAARAGFDPYGLPALLQHLAAERPDNPTFALAFSTHPDTAQRLEHLALAMGTRLDQFVSSGAPATIKGRIANYRAP